MILRFFSNIQYFSILLIFLLFDSPAHAKYFRCLDNDLIKVSAPDDSMVEHICTASAGAIKFLSQYKLLAKRPIEIEIIEKSINSHGYMAYGSYDRQNESIQLMSLGAVLYSTQKPQMYGQRFDDEHYQGAIAHEVAHAIFHQNSRNIEGQLSNVAQEYLAHSTQLGILSAERRKKIIEESDVGPWESGDSISEVYMGLHPAGFAVKSYLHLTQMAHSQPFIKLLLNNNWFYISVP